jgi:hypothetical protein
VLDPNNLARAALAARAGQWFLPQTLAQRPATGFKGALGRLAQLEEHLVYTERVGGSSPSAPTIFSEQFKECAQHGLRRSIAIVGAAIAARSLWPMAEID